MRPSLECDAHGEGHGRSWVSLRQRLNEALVETGERQIERMKSLPKMAELVTAVRDGVSLVTTGCRVLDVGSRFSPSCNSARHHAVYFEVYIRLWYCFLTCT